MSEAGIATLTPEIREQFASPEYRVEGRLKVTGAARYTADVQMPGMLHARFLLSPVPHARIVSVDTTAAKAVPGVHAVLTGEDVRGQYFGRRLLDWPVLAWDRVRFVGDRVAAVAAETRQAAEEAVRLVQVEYEELPAVFDIEDALRDDAPILHEDRSQYTYIGPPLPPVTHPNQHGYARAQKGEPDIERVFAQAHRVFEHTFFSPRIHQGYIEPHAAVVWIDDEGVVHVISTNKAPFTLRQQMAVALGLPVERIVVDNWFIGGDFGGKGHSPDEYGCYFLARATGRPIKSVSTYAEELQAMNPRHSALLRLRTAVDREGRFIAHRSEVIFNGGAYAAAKPYPTLVPTGGFTTLVTYNVPNALLELKCVYTNTMPGGSVRAPGQLQALFASESHVDMIAHELGMDPLEFRLRNAVRQGDTTPSGEPIGEARAVDVLETLRREGHWGEPLPPNRGRGLALGTRPIHGGRTTAVFRLLPDATIEVITAAPDQGTGAHTVIHRVAAAILSVDSSRIRVTHGDTREAPFDSGAGGSRVTNMLAEASRRGATQLKLQLEELASEVLGWPAGEVHLERDRFVLANGAESASFTDVARRITRGTPLELSAEYDGTKHAPGEPGDFDFAGYLVDLEVDPATGQYTIHDALLVADVGTIINLVAHQGQLDGGFIMGLGGAMMEEVAFQDGRVITLNLGEYKLPTVADAPPFRTVLLPTTQAHGPFGAKMAGELTNTTVAPAVANAVAAAVGVRITSLPITAERIYRALRARQ